MGSLDELGGQASELDGFFHGALENNCGLGPAAGGGDGGSGNDAKKRKEWEKMLAAAIDEEQAGFSSDDDGSGGGDDSGSVGVRPVVLARPAANDLGVLPGRGVRSAAPTTAADWRKQASIPLNSPSVNAAAFFFGNFATHVTSSNRMRAL